MVNFIGDLQSFKFFVLEEKYVMLYMIILYPRQLRNDINVYLYLLIDDINFQITHNVTLL